MDKCSLCSSKLNSSCTMICSKCQSKYHYSCVSFSLDKYTNKTPVTWKCPSCFKIEPQIVDEGEDFLPGSATNQPEIQVCPKVDLKKELAFLKNAYKDSWNTNRLLEKKISSLESRYNAFEERIRSCDSEMEVINNGMYALQEELERQMQISLSNQLEIRGIPEFPSECLDHVLIMITTKLNVDMDLGDIDWILRVGSRNMNQMSHNRNIAVRFTRRAPRDDILRAIKMYRGLTSVDLEIPGPPSRLFINERLTKRNQAIFRETRYRCRGAGYKYVWIKNGFTHIRKCEGRHPICIKTITDLERFLPIPGSMHYYDSC